MPPISDRWFLTEALNKTDLGIKVAGGKGKTSRKAPEEIVQGSARFNISTHKTESLVYSSRMSAKVDNALVQDNYQLYHHSFFFTEKGDWAVIQQGMNDANRYARRYHWKSGVMDFVQEPHAAICGEKEQDVLNLTLKDHRETQKSSLDLVNSGDALRFLNTSSQKTLGEFFGQESVLHMPVSHIFPRMRQRNLETLRKAKEYQAAHYEELVALPGIGAQTLRALALASELVYGTQLLWKDPVKYSFAHGGKDSVPYSIDRKHYDGTVQILKQAIEEMKLGEKEKMKALQRLTAFAY